MSPSAFGYTIYSNHILYLRIPVDTTLAADIDDTSRRSISDPEIRRSGLYDVEGCSAMYREHRLPLFRRRLVHHGIPSEARIIDDNINLAVAEVCRLLDEVINGFLVGDVARDRQRLATCGIDAVGYTSGLCCYDVNVCCRVESRRV